MGIGVIVKFLREPALNNPLLSSSINQFEVSDKSSMNRLARIVSILLILMILPAQAQEACSHNWEEVGGNAKLNPFPTRRPVSSSHGWVEDFRGPSLAPLAEIAWCNICNDATAQETWGIQCASSNGGYG